MQQFVTKKDLLVIFSTFYFFLCQESEGKYYQTPQQFIKSALKIDELNVDTRGFCDTHPEPEITFDMVGFINKIFKSLSILQKKLILVDL